MSIKFETTLRERIAAMPQLDEFVGQPITIIVEPRKLEDEGPPVSFEPHPRKRAGWAKGRIQLSDDFDAPLDDFKDYM